MKYVFTSMSAEIPQLLEKYLDNRMTETELSEFRKQLVAPENQKVIELAIQKVLEQKRFKENGFADKETIFNTIVNQPKQKDPAPESKMPFLQRNWLKYAAAVIVVAGAALWLANREPAAKIIAKTAITTQPDIAPGGNRAILTLADGSTIILDSAANGALASQGNTKVLKLNGGALSYKSGAPDKEVLYNTISTPRGGQYQVVLPDGSKVWLNAESSIKFPTFFRNRRDVEVTGEVYFEISPVRDQPFFVNLKGTQVQVLGTAFNVNAYEDENGTRTTLVQGSVKIVEGNNEKNLQPGQQALSQEGMGIQVKMADVEQETAWKNGYFQFNRSDIKTVMRQFARWYDIDVEYKGSVSDRFVGYLSRDASISTNLKSLESTGLVKFTITGKTIIVE